MAQVDPRVRQAFQKLQLDRSLFPQSPVGDDGQPIETSTVAIGIRYLGLQIAPKVAIRPVIVFFFSPASQYVFHSKPINQSMSAELRLAVDQFYSGFFSSPIKQANGMMTRSAMRPRPSLILTSDCIVYQLLADDLRGLDGTELRFLPSEKSFAVKTSSSLLDTNLKQILDGLADQFTDQTYSFLEAQRQNPKLLTNENPQYRSLKSCPGCDLLFLQEDVKVCVRCQRASYCSQACQKKHWKVHKVYCAPAEGGSAKATSEPDEPSLVSDQPARD